ALGVVQVGLGFLVLVAGAKAAGAGATPVIFIFLIYLIHTMGELCLSPVGLSAMNRLTPAHMASLIMGAWFFASATGNFTAGLISAATGGEGAGPERVLEVYSNVGWLAVGVGVAMLVVAPLIRRLMHLDTLRDDTELAGQAELGEPAAAGMEIGRETRPSDRTGRGSALAREWPSRPGSLPQAGAGRGTAVEGPQAQRCRTISSMPSPASLSIRRERVWRSSSDSG